MYNGFGPLSILDKLKDIWENYNKYIILAFSFILVVTLSLVLSNNKTSKLNEYLNVERIMIINAQNYVKNNNIESDYYISLNNLNIKIDDKFNCERLSGVYKENDNYYPYLICKDYTSKAIKEVIEKNKENETYAELNGETVYLIMKTKYQEQGVTKKNEDYQVNIKDNDVGNGLNFVTYYINENGKNIGELKRIVIAEEIEGSYPVLTLIGNKNKSIPKNSRYTEQGYKAIDEKDGNITDKVQIEGTVDTSTPGTYKLTYTVTNSKNKTTKVERTVIVNEEDIKLDITHTLDKNLSGKKSGTIALVITGAGYKYTLLPDNSKNEAAVITYTVYKNGTYDFLVYDKNDNGEAYSVKVDGLDPYRLTLIYNGNGQTSFFSESDGHDFSLDINGNVLDNGKQYKAVIDYDKQVNSQKGLEDHNGTYFYFEKIGYHGDKGKEWFVENSKGQKTYFDQSNTKVKAEDIAAASGCDLSKKNCTVTVKVNWAEGYDNTRPITKRFLIGDSRTVGMFRGVNSDSKATVEQLAAGRVTIGMDTWSCKSAMRYDWMVSTGIPNIESQLDSHSALIILMGVNGLDVDNYVSYLEQKLPSWQKKGVRVYYVAVMPCNGDRSYMNKKIDAFNAKIQTVEGIRYIDVHTYMMQNGFNSPDGLHFTSGTYRRVYEYIMSHLEI